MNRSPSLQIAPQSAAELAEKVAALGYPAAYSDNPGRIRCIETHMSWVFLTDRYAYKLKKPVCSPFLDFRTLRQRRSYCEEELRLNRRLANAVYVDVIPLRRNTDGILQLNGRGTTVDYLVRMLRLPEARQLDTAIARGSLFPFDIAAVIDTLVEFYRRADKVDMAPADYRRRFLDGIDDNERVLSEPGYALPQHLVRKISEAQRRLAGTDLLMERAAAGRIVDGHGDLRPEHIYLGPPVQIIDCLEFDRRLRLLDPAEELAFLALECTRLGSGDTGAALLSCYSQRMEDPVPEPLWRFYRSFRACIRAKLAIWHTDDPAVHDHALWHRRALEYLSMGERALNGYSQPPTTGLT